MSRRGQMRKIVDSPSDILNKATKLLRLAVLELRSAKQPRRDAIARALRVWPEASAKRRRLCGRALHDLAKALEEELEFTREVVDWLPSRNRKTQKEGR